MQTTDSTCFRPLQLSKVIAAIVILLSKRSFYVLTLDLIFILFAGAVMILEQPLFYGGR